MKKNFFTLFFWILLFSSFTSCNNSEYSIEYQSQNDNNNYVIEADDNVPTNTNENEAVSNEKPTNAINQTEELLAIDIEEFDDIREIYQPINGCASTRLFVEDIVYVSYGGSPNALRSEPDVHPSDNILYRAMQGEQLKIVGGPACSYGWILWEVKTTNGIVGWTPESDGEEFWLVPITEPRELPSTIASNPELYNLYEEINSVMSDNSKTTEEKQNQIKIAQDTYGEEVISYIIRYVPVYNADRETFESFDSVMRGFASDYGDSSTGSPIESDPVGAGLKIFFDPSTETITNMLGLSELGGGESPSSMKTGLEPTEAPTKVPTKVPTKIPTQGPQYWTIIYKNEFSETIYTAIHYLDLDGNWITEGWWKLAPGETVTVAYTRNTIYYVYAESDGADYIWGDQGGDKYMSVRGSEKKFPFIELNLNMDNWGTYIQRFIK